MTEEHIIRLYVLCIISDPGRSRARPSTAMVALVFERGAYIVRILFRASQRLLWQVTKLTEFTATDSVHLRFTPSATHYIYDHDHPSHIHFGTSKLDGTKRTKFEAEFRKAFKDLDCPLD